MSSLAIAIPIYNEQECIKDVLNEWRESLKSLDPYFVVVNDGSTDRSREILNKMALDWPKLIVIHQKNAGHGMAVRRAYDEAIQTQADYVFQVDSDDQFSPKDFFNFWAKKEDSPFILGYRKKRHDPFYRKFISFFLRQLISSFFDVQISDANVPYRLFKASYLRELLFAIPFRAFAPNVFLSILAFKDQRSVPQVEVIHKQRETGQVSLVSWNLIKACLRSTLELFSFRYTAQEKVKFVRHGQSITYAKLHKEKHFSDAA